MGLVQAWECTSTRQTPWNILSLLTDAGMLFLEISLVAFLLQGNHASGKEALTRTFVVSGLAVAFDAFFKVILLTSVFFWKLCRYLSSSFVIPTE